ncbi:MAG TPA: YdeI/OmpD-associated family protein [Chitinophagaceae bacterium]|jgi:uncharacterized protein YdeI (YjbR/CyaY-like superfamily)|nr:YdeI/OmpD-associated family protein [Chitinophagaceae bacterium]
MKEDVQIFHPESPEGWRKWLEQHHLTEQSVWLVCHTKKSGKKTISWSESVDVALCFGWIDSKKIKIDEETSYQFFSRRKPKSTWSRINKEKVAKLIGEGLMTKAGLEAVEIAKENGSWTVLDPVEELVIPEDLEEAFRSRQGSKQYFMSLSKSARKILLQWLVLAKKPETRKKRVDELAEEASQGRKPKPFQ